MRGLLTKAHALAAEQHFLHWQIAFPGVWRNWISAEPEGGFDAVIGNPPWDRMKMQEVEWFAARAPQVARQARAADRKAMIAKMKQAGDPLIDLYERASGLAERAMTLARRGGDYPLLSRGDINIYSLFVERAQALIKPDGIAGLLVPSGIASDFGASAFFPAKSRQRDACNACSISRTEESSFRTCTIHSNFVYSSAAVRAGNLSKQSVLSSCTHLLMPSRPSNGSR